MYSPTAFGVAILLLQGVLIQAFPLGTMLKTLGERGSDWASSISERGADWFMTGTECSPKYQYNISHQYAIKDQPQLVTGAVCNATYSGCNLGDTLGYAVTVTTTLGFHLDLAQIFGLGIQGDVSLSTTNAEAVTISQSCPPGFTCGLQVVASKWNVSGWQMTSYPDQGGNYQCHKKPTWDKYEVHFPMIQDNAQPNAAAVVEYSICIENNSVNLFKRPVSIPLCPAFPNDKGPGVDYAVRGPGNSTVVTASS